MRKERIKRLLQALSGLDVGIYAAHACYFLVLAAFPALVLVLSLLRYTGLQVENLMDLLKGYIPSALMVYIERLIVSTYENSSSAMVGLSALTALWSASRGVFGILTGFNAIYGVSEDRGYIYTRTVSFVYTLLFLVVLLLTLALHVFGTTILTMLENVDNVLVQFLWNLIDLRFIFLLIVQTLLFTAMYTVMPNRRNRVLSSIPGAVLASLGWLTFSDLFSIYVENFSRYSNIYGSVYAVALSMLWLYCCMSILFYGAALNRYLMNPKER